MRILLDECVDPRVKRLFPGHEIKTVHEMGWDRLADGPLLASAHTIFDVLLTIDRGLEFQQNLKKVGLCVVVVLIPKNQFIYYELLADEIHAVLATARRGSVIHVPRKQPPNR
jgi:hypothetical protein